MLAALVALAGVFVSSYLTLYKLGYIGTLACAVGSCETVQTSRWATLFGLPVGAWGIAYYVGVLAIALYGLRGMVADSLRVSQLLVAVTATGVLFSAWLTYLELFVIHAICMWCVISAILAAILFALALVDMGEVTAINIELAEEAAERLKVDGYGKLVRNTEEVSIRALGIEDAPR